MDFFPQRPASSSTDDQPPMPPPKKPQKRKVETTEVKIKPKTNRFPGTGYQLEPKGFPFERPKTNLGPFQGKPQRIAPESELRKNAIDRMQEIAERALQSTRKIEMVQRGKDLRRAINRGGKVGDVVPLGKRKRDGGDDRGTVAARKTRDVAPGLQRYSIAT